jgi:hypothetical protein
MFKYNEIRTKAALEKKKEAGNPRDCRANKGVHMYHSSVI